MSSDFHFAMGGLRFPVLPGEEEESLEWAYTMRREMQEITTGLFLGPYAAAMKSKKQALKDMHITHIVCVRQQIEANFIKPNFSDDFIYLVLDVADKPTENIIKHFVLAKEFIDNCFNLGGRVLVHGNAGISRSAALVIAYVMETYGLTYRDAFRYVQQRRFCINPNEGFVHQLMEYEAIYQARLMTGSLEEDSLVLNCASGMSGVKRGLDDDESME
ncbi:serine/threonine/tyrosine-interacting protein B-like [Saccoglossus kowalevskii]|uniref:Serine/threonine/tyrosine-interacting protein A-like n=1 Tax=Saccoglossus kowalevskii TaxID=10224 RepID=A0ABM0GIX8_SACKO|nr:PREDICTED: serine/threonine/tyrosine-interacting protein A-like [Saccoglossus kowalevskii]